MIMWVFRERHCDTCHGTAVDPYLLPAKPCRRCKGTGRLMRGQKEVVPWSTPLDKPSS